MLLEDDRGGAASLCLHNSPTDVHNYLALLTTKYLDCKNQDIVCPEAVKLDDLDPAAVAANYEAAKARASSAEAGSPDAAEALIEVEVNRAMGGALGLSLA